MAPGVRDAFSEALGAKNRLLVYRKEIRCEKMASAVREAFSKARRTADSPTVNSCRTGHNFSARTAHALFVRSGPFHHSLGPANSELVSGGPFPCAFDGTRYQKQPPLGGEQT